MRFLKIVFVSIAIIIAIPIVFAAAVVAYIKFDSRHDLAITSGGLRRTYELYVPPNQDPAVALPLVITLHPAAGWPAMVRSMSRWDRLASERRFMVAYPAGRSMPQVWGDGPTSALVDVQFIADLIDTIAAHHRVDTTRIYVNGWSNGGMMTIAVSCRLANRVAAAGLVSAAPTLPHLWEWCGSAPPVPAIIVQGTADKLVPFNGGPLGDPFNPQHPIFPSVHDWVAGWAKHNRCAVAPADSALSSQVIRTTYRDCADSATVVLYTLQGGGHQWPGGKALPAWWVGPMNNGVDATRQLWEFFEAHPMSSRALPGRASAR